MASARESGRAVALAAVEALGCGLDLTADYRLKYRKGPLLNLQHSHTKDLLIPGGITIPNVSRDVKCDTGERMRFTSEVMKFQQMSQWFNKNAFVEGKIPLGFFNAMFDLSGSWRDDASQTKSLAFDGCFITLYKLHLTRSNLVLREEVKKDIPSTWDPEGLARFIEKYGTHIIVAVSIGGQDVLYLKESHSSLLSTQDIHKHLKIAGDKCFSDGSGERSIDFKENEDMTIISRRRGGILSSKTHSKWQETVDSSPDAISFSFVPITSLISGASGSGFVQHAINIYLRYKPPVEEIQYFLDFQVPRQWIPVYNELPLGLSRKQALSLSLQFSLMGPKLYVNTLQVVVIKKPVTGVRLYLEGKKNNRLAIHLQHLSVLPKSLERFWNENIPVEQPKWNSSNGAAKNWFEPVYWKSFSHVCTTPVKYKREWLSKKDTVFVVTGARLEVKMHGLASALHLSLLFTKIPECTIQTSRWDQPPASDKTRFCSSLSTTFSRTKKAGKKKATPVIMDSAVYPGGPPKPIQSQKLLKFVDMTELTKGPQDAPGHWIVTAARLELDRGKISIRVKYSLLNYS